MRHLFCLAAFIATTACAPDVMSSSGADYVARAGITDPKIAEAAAHRPNLRFPARVGVVRLVYGQIKTPSAEERALFQQALPSGIGEVTLLGALDAQLAGLHRYQLDQHEIRRLAARHHLDYALVIALDPGQNSAQAAFLDVATGYPYTSIETKLPGRGKRGFWGGRLHSTARLDAATLAMSQQFAPDLTAMLKALRDHTG
jgi:hypothetical protein